MKKVLFCFLVCLSIHMVSTMQNNVTAQTLTVAKQDPTACDATDGKLMISGLAKKTSYQIIYQRMGFPNDTISSISSDTAGLVVIQNLPWGIYSQITAKTTTDNITSNGSVILDDKCHILKMGYVNPACGIENGRITLFGLDVSSKYKISYSISYSSDTILENLDDEMETDTKGNLVIPQLAPGTYNWILVTSSADKNKSFSTYPITLVNNNNNCIAAQKTNFSATAYANFTGIQDDDPVGYTQVFARLSQPLNKIEGISAYDSNGWKRLIPVRNAFLQLTYGNTDNFKMYTSDFNGTRYVNRLDLYGHSYFNGNATFNLLTYIIPEYWKSKYNDLGHIYFDVFTSLLLTNVVDSTPSKYNNGLSPTKTYNVKSDVYGFNLNGKFNSIGSTNFTIEAGLQLFWIFPSSKIINGSLNPQNSDLTAYNPSVFTNPDTTTLKSFVSSSKNVAPYVGFSALVKYNTGQASDNTSNIFIHYQHVSNYAGYTSGSFPNSYWQFQIGYTLDISKIFVPQTTSSTAQATSKTP